MRSIKRQVPWIPVALFLLMMAVLLSGCEPLEDLGDALGNLLRRIAP